jgi:hypothetical protein
VGLAGGSLDSLQGGLERCCCDAVDGGYQGRHVREQNKESKIDERDLEIQERAREGESEQERLEREEKQRR